MISLFEERQKHNSRLPSTGSLIPLLLSLSYLLLIAKNFIVIQKVRVKIAVLYFSYLFIPNMHTIQVLLLLMDYLKPNPLSKTYSTLLTYFFVSYRLT